MLCRYCGCFEAKRPRGLCYHCYRLRSVRRNYRMLRKHFHPDINGRRPPAPGPTEFLPGTRAKVRVLRQRFRDRCTLWHPDDARINPNA